MKKDIPIILVISVLVALIAILFQSFGVKKQETGKIDPPVIVSRPEMGSLSKEIQINGYIEPEEVVTVLPRAMGLLDVMYVDVGDTVEKDQLIARVDSELLELNLRQADSALLFARQNLERITALYEQKITSLQNYELAKNQYDSALSLFEMAKLRYHYAEIHSPISGAILEKHTSEGSLISQQTPLMTIGTIDKLQFTARIPERYFDIFYRETQSIGVTISRPDQSNFFYTAEIRTIAPVISRESKNFEVICTINNGDSSLRPGMNVRINFLLSEKKNIFYLPLTTLINQNTAWIYDLASRTAKKIPVSLNFFNDLYFQIPEEIKDFLFITEGQSFLRDGQTVAVVNKEIFN